jgi:hypothetical protein
MVHAHKPKIVEELFIEIQESKAESSDMQHFKHKPLHIV